MRTLRFRLSVVLLAITLAFSSCALKHKSTAVKLAVATEVSLGSLQDSSRELCDPAVPPLTPIVACTELSTKLGLSTEKFRTLSRGLAKAFDFMRLTLVPALKTWRAGDPPPVAFAEFLTIANEVLAIARTVPQSQAASQIIASISSVTSAMAELSKILGVR